jgi:predicted DCC family thiol-disulfide oxidoreductase YuxK
MAISVFTEITEERAADLRGWVLYDGECQFCLGWVRRMKPIFAPRGFAFLPLQTPWVRAFFDLPEAELLSEMRVVFNKFNDFHNGNDEHTAHNECAGRAFGGVDAIVELAKHVWWAWPLVALAQIPIARDFLRARYRAIAARRYCVNGACAVPVRESGFRSHSDPEPQSGERRP